MADKYPTRSLPNHTVASEDQTESIGDQYGQVVDQSETADDQPGQIADHTHLDPVQTLIKDQVSALQYAQTTGATTVNFIETQYNASGGQTIQNISYPGQAEPTTSDISKESDPSVGFNLHDCQDELRAYYLDEMGKVDMLPWIPEESKEMESIFVDVELVRKEEPDTSQNIKSNEDLLTLETNQGQRVNKVLVTGDAGSGKSTTTANLAYKWAKNKSQSPLSKFSLVFLIRMKDIEDSNSSIVDIIFQNLLPEDTDVSKEGLSKYMKENAKDILFAIDGMDEDSSGALKNKSSGITKLLHNRKLRKSCVILTTRPKNISDLGTYASHYTQVNLVGFSVKSIHNYIMKFFRNDKETVKLLFRKLEAEPHVQALASVPVLLLMICMLWEDQRITPKTKTQLYQKTIRFLWRRYKARMTGDLSLDEDSDNEEFDEDLKDLLNKLGEVALNNTHLYWEQFIFTEKEFGRRVCNLGCQVGILKREQSRAGLERKTSIAFVHATFLVFCAAFHLANLLDAKQKKIHDFDGHLLLEIEDTFIYHENVFAFCCGILPQVTTTFLEFQIKHTFHIPPETNEPFYFDVSAVLQHINESQLSYEQCSNLITLVSSVSSKIVLTDDLIPSVLYMLELYKSSATQTGFLSIVKFLDVKTGCTHWLPTLLSYTYNLNDCIVHLGVSGIVRDINMMYKALSELPNIKKLTLGYFSIIDPLFRRLDATNLLNFLTTKKVKLAVFVLLGFQFDENVMVRYLSSTSSSISILGLSGTLGVRGQFASINNVIDILPRLKHLIYLELSRFQIGSAIKHLRPLMSQLEALRLIECCLHEKHLKELFSFLSRAQKLKLMNLSQNVLSVASVQALVESLKKMPALEELSLEDTGLSDESACILASFVRVKSAIALCLDDNPDIGHAGKEALRGLPLKRFVSSSLCDGDYEDIDTL